MIFQQASMFWIQTTAWMQLIFLLHSDKPSF
jgi:hypothetical protein